jgi:hypothetical protein
MIENMPEEMDGFISKEEFKDLKNGKINNAHFYTNKETLIKYKGHVYENEIQKIIIRKINLQDEKFFLKDLIKTITFNEWLCLKHQGMVHICFSKNINPQENIANLITIKILEKRAEKIFQP